MQVSRSSFNRYDALAALIKIDPHHDGLRELIEESIATTINTDEPWHLTLFAIGRMMEHRGEEAWVKALVDQAMESPEHPAHDYVRRTSVRHDEDDAEEIRQDLIRVLHDANGRDAMWAFVNGAERPAAFGRYGALVTERTRAAETLAASPGWSAETLDQLLATLRHVILESPKPPRYDQTAPVDLRAGYRDSMWRQEMAIARYIGLAIGTMLEAEPLLLNYVIADQRTSPAALVLTLIRVPDSAWSTWRENLEVDRPNVSDDSMAYALEALISATYADDRYGREEFDLIIRSLGQLPTSDPRRIDRLRHFIEHGQTMCIRQAALESIGWTRPLSADAANLIRAYFRSKEPGMRQAAYLAIENTGWHGHVFVEELLLMTEQRLGVYEGHHARALYTVAPDDRRVCDFVEDVIAKQAERAARQSNRTMSADTRRQLRLIRTADGIKRIRTQ
ncbi:MAG: hypothetical protein AAF432_12715 [Planctomycetota bacterium]